MLAPMCSLTDYYDCTPGLFMAWTYTDDGELVMLEWSDEAQAFVIPKRAED